MMSPLLPWYIVGRAGTCQSERERRCCCVLEAMLKLHMQRQRVEQWSTFYYTTKPFLCVWVCVFTCVCGCARTLKLSERLNDYNHFQIGLNWFSLRFHDFMHPTVSFIPSSKTICWLYFTVEPDTDTQSLSADMHTCTSYVVLRYTEYVHKYTFLVEIPQIPI